ncbi:hypothetical protein H5410_017897, partial [Solanum commersonii]
MHAKILPEVPGFLSASAASLIIELVVFVKLAVINILLVQGKLQTAWLQIVVFCIHSELSNLESKLRSYFSLRGQCHRAAEKCSFGHHVIFICVMYTQMCNIYVIRLKIFLSLLFTLFTICHWTILNFTQRIVHLLYWIFR